MLGRSVSSLLLGGLTVVAVTAGCWGHLQLRHRLRRATAGRHRQAFEDFVVRHQRHYASSQEREARFTIFRANLEHIEEANAQGHSYTLAVNSFTDLSQDEFAARHLGPQPRPTEQQPAESQPWSELPLLGVAAYSGRSLPDAVDWTTQGAVTPVKDQRRGCSADWSFSAVGAVESAWKIAAGSLTPLSDQQLVDCAPSPSQGCSGGRALDAFRYLANQALCTEASYKYVAKPGQCHQDTCTVAVPRGAVAGFVQVPRHDEHALMEALLKQPVVVATELDWSDFQFYHGGILSKRCRHRVFQQMVAVGYGVENGLTYWRLKNSWGPFWGEDGYVRFERGLPARLECSIVGSPSYPVMKANATITGQQLAREAVLV